MAEGGSLTGQRVFVFAKGFAPDEGGMQTYAAMVARGYAALGAAVTVFTQSSAGPRRVRDGDLDIVDIGPGRSPMVPWRLLAAVRRERDCGAGPAFVHATTWRTGVIAMLSGLAYTVTVHGREIAYAKGLAAMVMGRVLARAERIVAVSHYTRNYLLDSHPGLAAKTVVAWNGTERGKTIPSEKPKTARPLVLTLCRIEARKNVANALAAAIACSEAGAKFDYVIAGRGPELDALQAQYAVAGRPENIRIAGYVDDAEVERLYARAAIFLHPQITIDQGRDFEGFGIVIADAMAAGAAPIVGRDGGTPELVEDGVSGLVIDGRDPAAITRALNALLTDPAKLRAMGAAAIARAEHFTWERHCRIALGEIAGD